MRSRSAIENARASLVLAFPHATEDGLDRAAQLVVRWAAEGIGATLDPSRSALLYEELWSVTESHGEPPTPLLSGDIWVAADESERTWRPVDPPRPDPWRPEPRRG